MRVVLPRSAGELYHDGVFYVPVCESDGQGGFRETSKTEVRVRCRLDYIRSQDVQTQDQVSERQTACAVFRRSDVSRMENAKSALIDGRMWLINGPPTPLASDIRRRPFAYIMLAASETQQGA